MLALFCLPALSASPLVRDASLPAALLPRYTLEVSLSDERLEWRGKGSVTWTNPTGRPLSELPILLPPNSGPVARLSVPRIEVTQGPGATFAVGHPSDGLLTFERPLAPGESVTLSFDFSASLQPLPAETNDLFSQGMSQLGALSSPAGGGDYGLLAAGDGIVVVASAFPTIRPFVGEHPAHHVIRGAQSIGDMTWNTPASFSVRLEVPAALQVVTNLADTVVLTEDGRKVLHCEGEGVTDFVVVGSRDFVAVEEKVGSVIVRSWARQRDAAAGRAVLQSGARALRFLERYGPYPFTELDLVEATLMGGAGGVEFSGLALVAGFLYREPQAGPLGALMPLLSASGLSLPLPEMGDQRDFVVAHEVAHQWSPAVVGADAWNEPVLDEPLAQYLAWRAVTNGLPAASAAKVAERQITLNYALHRLMGGKDAAAARPTSAYASNLEYAGLVYGKAPGLYLALERQLGRAALDKALAAAVRENRWRTIDHRAWLSSLEAAGAKGAISLGTRWWEQPQGDADLGIDPEGRAAMRMLFGAEMARQLEATFAAQGMTPAQWFALFLPAMSGSPAAPAAPALPGMQGLEGLQGLEDLLDRLTR